MNDDLSNDDLVAKEMWEDIMAHEADDWVQYTHETYGPDSPEYQAVKIK